MRPPIRLASWLALALTALASAAPTTTPTTSPSALHLGPIPDGLGVNIHFTDPQPGEMQQIADAGFTWVRMDFVWQSTERERGVYDFSAYDRLFAALDQFHIRPIFILDYGNPLYDPDGASPHTDASRASMAKWAVAAVSHFKGRGAVWEMWNEPNIGFWKPKPNADDYVKLALAVADAIRAATPNETLVGPGCSGVDLAFLESCFKAGLLARWDAVSLHPYRQDGPESVAIDYAKVRGLIARYAPAGKDVPIISSEWGYSAAWHDFDEQKQADMLAREFLTNLANGVPLSIWYDWRDDGESLTDPEHHFGVVRNAYTRTTTRPVYDPKPAYETARGLTSRLGGFRFVREMDAESDVHLLLFGSADGAHQRLALWTTAKERTLFLSLGDEPFVGIIDEATPVAERGVVNLIPHTQAIHVTHRVQYLMPHDDASSDLLRIAAAWDGLPPMVRDHMRGAVTIHTSLRNPLDRAITVTGGDQQRQTVDPGQTRPLDFTVKLTRSDEPLPIHLSVNVEGVGAVGQRTQFVATNPLRLSIEPSVAGPWSVRIENPSGEAFAGRLAVFHNQFGEKKEQDVRFGSGEREHRVPIGFVEDAHGQLMLGAALDVNDAPPVSLPRRTFVRFGPSIVVNGRMAAGYAASTGGDAKVTDSATLAIAAGPTPNTQAIEVRCALGDGWKFAEVHPPEAVRKLDGKPRALLLWVWSDASGFSPRLRFTDSGNETFQPIAGGGPMTWTGWRLMRFTLDGSDHPGHWGGDGNGTIDYPIRLDTLLLLDKPGPASLSGTVRFAGPMMEYD